MAEVETEMLLNMDADSLFGLCYFSESTVLSPDDGFFYLFLGGTRCLAQGWYSLSGGFLRFIKQLGYPAMLRRLHLCVTGDDSHLLIARLVI